MHEGDFMITTSRVADNTAKEKIIKNQLDQLGLENCYDVFIVPDSDSDSESESDKNSKK